MKFHVCPFEGCKIYYVADSADFFSAIILSGCATPPPKDHNNLCNIFREYPKWYEAALDMEDEWGTPMQVVYGVCETGK